MVGTFYSGPASSFPGSDTWLDFDTLFNINKPQMFQTGDSGADLGAIYNAIEQAAQIGVESRVILAIIMQESTGDVGVGGTGGIMQCDGSPSFPGQHDIGQDNITAMIMAGTQHFKGNLQSNDDSDTASAVYEACRLYNSGAIDKDNLSDPCGNFTASYVSDIANRLQGKTD